MFQKLQVSANTAKIPNQDDGLTGVFGGFRGATSKEEADRWLHMVLEQADAPQVADTYVKGNMANFNGLIFGRFRSTTDRNAAIKKVRQKALAYNGQNIWAKPEQPLETRVLENILFGAKNMLLDWGWHRQSVWVDNELSSVLCGDDPVLSAVVLNGEHKLTYEPGWEDYIFNKDHPDNTLWKECIKTNSDKLSSKSAVGGGKGGEKGSNKGKGRDRGTH